MAEVGKPALPGDGVDGQIRAGQQSLRACAPQLLQCVGGAAAEPGPEQPVEVPAGRRPAPRSTSPAPLRNLARPRRIQTNSKSAMVLRRQEAHPRQGDLAGDYDRQGYLIVPDVLDSAGLDLMRAETAAICRGLRGPIDGVLPAEEQADDDEVLRRYLCIHFPHKISPLMLDIARDPAVGDALTSVMLVNHYISAESLLPSFSPGEREAMGILDHREIELACGWGPVRVQGHRRPHAPARPAVAATAAAFAEPPHRRLCQSVVLPGVTIPWSKA